MGQETTKYQYTDEDGDVHTIHHVQRWCRCASGNCEDDTLEYYDPFDGPPVKQPNVLPYHVTMQGTEMKYVISDLIDMAVASGQLTKVDEDE